MIVGNGMLRTVGTNQPLIEAVGLAHSFGLLAVLEPTNLSIGSDEIVALLGPSGCGKTT
ncbi:MAG: hypothetical protein QOD49_1825, partial [Actinomycetota bacterium]|nr:hypothetical protein [Actinomycetota bacterium]